VTFTLVRIAALLVPPDERAAWLAEWRAEYRHIAATEPAKCAAAFCLGAVPDALWMRRHHPRSERRPAHCLLALAVLLVLAATMAPHWCWLPPGVLTISAPGTNPRDASVTFDQYRSLATRPTFAAVAFYRIERRGNQAVALATSKLLDILELPAPGRLSQQYWQISQPIDSIELEPNPAPNARGFILATVPPGATLPRRWSVFTPRRLEGATLSQMTAVSYTLLMLVLATLAVAARLALTQSRFPISRRPVAIAYLCAKAAMSTAIVTLALPPPLFIFGFFAAFSWTLADQRGRCPVCLRRLVRPVTIGSASHTLLDWYGTELLCARGHGLLYEPEIPTSPNSARHWQSLDPSWAGLFRM
jgi:hypothetical protein